MPAGAAPTVIVQLSDPHLNAEKPEREAALAAAIEKVRGLTAEPVAVLVTGDLADGGDPAQYAVVRRLLDGLGLPVHVIPGNVDDRAALRAAFDLPGEGDEPIRYVVEAGPLRVVLTDSTIPGEIPGQLDVDWVAQQLDATPDHPTLLAWHHPPFATGVAGLDGVGLPEADRAAVATLLERSPQVVRVASGHVHLPASGVVGGRPAVTAPSVSFAIGLDLRGGSPAPSEEAVGFLVHVFTGGAIATHVVTI